MKIRHVLNNYLESHRLWNEVNLNFPRIDDLREWLKFNLQFDFKYKFIQWGDLFSYICHELWKDDDNCSFYKVKPSNPISILQKTSNLALEWLRALISQSHYVGAVTPRFHLPSSNILVHVDASFTDNL